MNVVLVWNGCAPDWAVRGRGMGAFSHLGPATTVLFHPAEAIREAMLAEVFTPKALPVRVDGYQPERFLSVLEESVRGDLFVFPGNFAGQELAGRLGARLGGSSLTGVQAARPDPRGLLCRRRTHSGRVETEFLLDKPPFCLSVDASGTAAAGLEPPEVLAELDLGGRPREAWILSRRLEPACHPGTAGEERFMLVAGRGAGSREGISRVESLARTMGAGFGVSRAVAMSAWSGLDGLIGISGRRIAPEVCIVAGASGATAFLAGIENSGFIVTINVDGSAPAHRMADVAVIGDCLAVLEALAAFFPQGGRVTTNND